MEHSYYKDKLSAYSDSDLEVQEMELLRRHLEGCAECRELLEKLSSLNQKIEELSGLKGSEYFESLAAKIDSRIAETESKVVKLSGKELNWFGWKIGAAAASLLLIATVSYYQWQDHESSLDRIIEQSTKPAQSVEVLLDSMVKSKSPSEEIIVAEEKADDKTVTTQMNEIEKGRPAGVWENKARTVPKKIVDVKEIQGMTEFETSSQSIVKPAPVLKQEQEKEDESLGDIAEEIVADFQIVNLPVTRIAAQTEREEVIARSVQYWRDKRDSLLIIKAEVSNSIEVSRILSARKRKSAILADSVESGYYNKDSSLALVWYKIGLLTIDSTEKKEAMEFLKGYVQRNKANSALVKEYLEELKD